MLYYVILAWFALCGHSSQAKSLLFEKSKEPKWLKQDETDGVTNRRINENELKPNCCNVKTVERSDKVIQRRKRSEWSEILVAVNRVISDLSVLKPGEVVPRHVIQRRRELIKYRDHLIKLEKLEEKYSTPLSEWGYTGMMSETPDFKPTSFDTRLTRNKIDIDDITYAPADLWEEMTDPQKPVLRQTFFDIKSSKKVYAPKNEITKEPYTTEYVPKGMTKKPSSQPKIEQVTLDLEEQHIEMTDSPEMNSEELDKILKGMKF